MEKSKNLEENLEKPDKKQWWPIYGIFKIAKDNFQGKATIIDEENCNKTEFCEIVVYQAVSLAIFTSSSAYGLYKLAERIFT